MRSKHADTALAWLTRGAVIAVVALVAAGLTWLPRLGGDAQADGRQRVEVWGWNIAAESLDGLTPAFEQQHPDIDVAVNVSGANLQSRFLLSLASGVGAPDVAQLQERETPKFTATSRLMDLTPVAQRYADQFASAFWSSCLYDGRVYAIPWDMGPCAVFYKRWVFEKFGIDPDQIETWDDFIEAGKKFQQASGGDTYMMPLSVGGLSDIFQILMQQNGGGVFDAEGRIIVESPQNREVLVLMRKILDAGITTPATGPELYASIKNDNIACYPSAVWFTFQIKDNTTEQRVGQWGVFRLPAFSSGGLRTSNLGGSVLVIPAQSAERDAAWLFVEYANCTVPGQVQQYRTKGLFPAFLPALEDPYFDEPDAFFGGQRVHRLFATDLDKIPPLTRTRDWNEAERMLRQTLSTWATQHLDNDAYLHSLAEALSRKTGREIAAPSSGGGS